MESLKSEGTNFVKLGEDYHESLRRLMLSLHALNAGPLPSREQQMQQKQGSAPPEKSFGEQLWSGMTTLDSKADSPPWGDDDLGEKFGVVYEGLRDGMNESMGHIAAKLEEIGKALTSMSKHHGENEDFNDSLMKQHVADLEGPNAPKQEFRMTSQTVHRN
ncbi:hypothetical protein AB0D04_21720 [Streptomyces sp. NPDC048483]|uniref:hypothetical protein n=1 Tax=Streptomyces sp. NPDC048483 TaxID=3154927 RepID=UPI0034474141